MFPIIQQVSTIRLQIVHRVSANANTDTWLRRLLPTPSTIHQVLTIHESGTSDG
jgi:hypothetical protein